MVFECVIDDIKEYQENDIDTETTQKIDNYFQKKHLINQGDLNYAIRLLITLVLFQENDKENKIKQNNNNIVNYLKSTDLWKNDINDDSFINDLNEFKSINIHINQIISLYEYLGKEFDETYFEDVKEKIKNDENPIIDDDPEAQENSDDDEDRI